MPVISRTAAIFVAMAALLLFAPGGARASSLTTLYSFTGGSDGGTPTTGLVVGPNGALYGANGQVVYEFTQNPDLSWSLAPIYTVAVTSLVGTPDVLYGVSGQTVVALTPPASGETIWTSSILHVFAGGKDGSIPEGIAIAPNGSIVGTTVAGGGSDACGGDDGKPRGCGTLFKLKKVHDKWKETILHAFKGGKDGALPFAAPSFDAKGNVYASTEQGGGSSARAAETSEASTGPGSRLKDSCDGYGTIDFYYDDPDVYQDLWRLACDQLGPEYASSVLFSILSTARFGAQASPERTQDNPPAPKAANALMATWTGGGITSDCPALDNNGCGAVGILTRPADGSTPWKLEVLHNFIPSDGALPFGYLTADGADTIYGVAPEYGNSGCIIGYGLGGCGTIYKLQNTANGWAWGGVVYAFPGGAPGTVPITQLLLYKGKLLGATSYGGIGCGQVGFGTLFALAP